MDLLEYGAVKNNLIVNVQVFDINITEEDLQNIADANQYDSFVVKTDRITIGSQLVNNIWVLPKPFNSWILNSDNNWEAPIPKTSENCYWSEDTLSWIESA